MFSPDSLLVEFFIQLLGESARLMVEKILHFYYIFLRSGFIYFLPFNIISNDLNFLNVHLNNI